MDIVYCTEKESVQFQTGANSSVRCYDNCLTVNMYFDPGYVEVKIKTAPIPDLTGYTPFERRGLKGFCKSEENKEISLYEEIDVIGENEQKVILSIQILDYTTKTTRAKTLDELFSYMPIVKFLASIQTIPGESDPKSEPPCFIIR